MIKVLAKSVSGEDSSWFADSCLFTTFSDGLSVVGKVGVERKRGEGRGEEGKRTRSWLSFLIWTLILSDQDSMLRISLNLFFKNSFIHLFLALLSLHCCVGSSLVAVSGGYSP